MFPAPGDASTIFRWTRKLTISADRIRRVRISWKPLLQGEAVLPTVANNDTCRWLFLFDVKIRQTEVPPICNRRAISGVPDARFLRPALREYARFALIASPSRLDAAFLVTGRSAYSRHVPEAYARCDFALKVAVAPAGERV
jgi:hypothetical protein